MEEGKRADLVLWNPAFFGVISTTPGDEFSVVDLLRADIPFSGGALANAGFDNISYGGMGTGPGPGPNPVPEPASLAIWAGVIGVGAFMRRRRAKASS